MHAHLTIFEDDLDELVTQVEEVDTGQGEMGHRQVVIGRVAVGVYFVHQLRESLEFIKIKI